MIKFQHTSYKAFLVKETNGKYVHEVTTLHTKDLPKSDVIVRVHYSSLNYKDALSATGNKGVTKKYPHTPGIDAAGVIVYSKSRKFKEGTQVIVTGYDLGMNTSGGFAEFISVPESWVVKLPKNISLKETMILGTAGFTAGISVSRLVEKVKPSDGKIIVTGATGGVGSVAINLLGKLGYDVVAVSGKETEHDYLKKLGATEVVERNTLLEMENKPILSALYAGGIDTVGGKYLENILKSLQGLGVVTTCGSVASTELNMTVFPFILRGISLVGISAQNYPMNLRKSLWNKLADAWKPIDLLNIYKEIRVEQISENIDLILQGKLKGRTLINLI